MESLSPGSVVRFREYEFLLERFELRKRGIRLKVQDQPLKVLSVLLEKPGTLVTREELRGTLWPQDTFVDFENGLNAAVAKLRQALADSADAPKFIETVPRRGYVFVAPVEVIGSAPVSSTIESPEETNALQAAPAPRSRLPAIRYALAGGGAAAALVLLVAGIVASSRTHEADSDSRWANLHAHRLTQSGQVQEAAISPDGQLVGYSTGDYGNEFGRTLRILNLQTGTDRELARGSFEYGSLAFSTDSLRIFFVQQAELYAMPVSGGAPTRIAARVVSPPSFSPGGKSIVFVRNEPEKVTTASLRLMRMGATSGLSRATSCPC